MYMTSAGTSGCSVLASSSGNVRCEQIRQKLNLLLGLGQTTIETTQVSVQSRVPQAVEQPSLHGEHGCEEARATMTHFKKIEQEYKKGIAKMNRMMHVQATQSRRLHQSFATIAELNMQVIELKKRMEDMDAKNRELSASIKQLKGESTSPSTTQSTAKVQEYSKSEQTSDMSHDTNTAPIDDNDLTATAKRRPDEPPLGEDSATIMPEVSTAKKAKIE